MFTSETGDVDLQQRDINGKGDFFINSGVQNYGIKGKTDRKAKIFSKNTITLDFLGNAYYRDYPYKMATHNHVFSLNGEIIYNFYDGLYYAAALSYLKKLFSFDNMGTWNRYKDLEIILPILSNKEIDHSYIKNYINSINIVYKKLLVEFIKKQKLDNVNISKEEREAIKNINSHKVEKFKVSTLFDIHPTRSYPLTNDELLKNKGNTPLVTNTSQNNGITDRISLYPTEKGNIITYSDTTNSDAIFYQPKDFIGYSHIQGLYPYKKDLWKENSLLYFVTLFRKSAKGQFNYGDKFNRKEAGNLNVLLPVQDNGEIDYEFMNNYINAIKKLNIQKILPLINDSDIPESNDIKSRNNYMSMAAEPFEVISIDDLNSINADDVFINYLIGYYRDKEHLDWILKNSLYNIPLNNRRGSTNSRKFFKEAQILILYGPSYDKQLKLFLLKNPRELKGKELNNLSYPSAKEDNLYGVYDLEVLIDLPNNYKEIFNEVKEKLGRRNRRPMFTTSESSENLKVILLNEQESIER